MAVAIADVESLTVQEMNLATSYGVTSTSTRIYTAGIAKAALAADGQVVEAICRNLEHARRANYYTTQAGIAHGATLGNSAGPVDSIFFVVTGGSAPGTRAAKEYDQEEIQAEIRNVLGLTQIDPHWAVEGKILYHNGSTIASNSGGGSVSVNATYPTYTMTSACQAPDEYLYTVLAGTLAMLFNVEGEAPDAGRFYFAQFEVFLNEIATGEPGAGTTQFRSIRNYQAATAA